MPTPEVVKIFQKWYVMLNYTVVVCLFLMIMWWCDHSVLTMSFSSLQLCIRPRCTGTLTVRRWCWRMAFWINLEMLMVSITTRSRRRAGACWRSEPATEQHQELMIKPSSWLGIWRDSWLHGEKHQHPVTDLATSLKPRAGNAVSTLRRITKVCSKLILDVLLKLIDHK